MKFAWADTKKVGDSNVVFLGVPDESGSHAARKGTSLGPNRIRKVSRERAIFTRKGMKSIAFPTMCASNIHVHDYGNIKKKHVSRTISDLVSKGKFPITVGGDHSITFEVLKGFDKVKKKISVVYFDAHPDFVCSSRNYYGSVVCDVFDLRYVDLKSSVEVGSRAIEKEEMANMKKRNMKVITPGDIAEKGVKRIFQEIKKHVGKNRVYLSIDVDVVDPGYAPGVDTPVPGGLSSTELMYLAKKVAELGLVGFDVMETSPPHDMQDMTSHLSAQLIINTLACLKLKKKL